MYVIRQYEDLSTMGTPNEKYTLPHPPYAQRQDARERMGKLAMLENNASYVLVQLDGEVEITLQKISNTF